MPKCTNPVKPWNVRCHGLVLQAVLTVSRRHGLEYQTVAPELSGIRVMRHSSYPVPDSCDIRKSSITVWPDAHSAAGYLILDGLSDGYGIKLDSRPSIVR
jgi:hypothetical protein